MKKEEKDWRMMQLPNGSGWPWRRTKREEEERCSYQMAQLLAMETDEERIGRLENDAATKWLSWSWRRRRKEEEDWRMMQLPNGSGWPWKWTRKEK